MREFRIRHPSRSNVDTNSLSHQNDVVNNNQTSSTASTGQPEHVNTNMFQSQCHISGVCSPAIQLEGSGQHMESSFYPNYNQNGAEFILPHVNILTQNLINSMKNILPHNLPDISNILDEERLRLEEHDINYHRQSSGVNNEVNSSPYLTNVSHTGPAELNKQSDTLTSKDQVFCTSSQQCVSASLQQVTCTHSQQCVSAASGRNTYANTVFNGNQVECFNSSYTSESDSTTKKRNRECKKRHKKHEIEAVDSSPSKNIKSETNQDKIKMYPSISRNGNDHSNITNNIGIDASSFQSKPGIFVENSTVDNSSVCTSSGTSLVNEGARLICSKAGTSQVSTVSASIAASSSNHFQFVTVDSGATCQLPRTTQMKNNVKNDYRCNGNSDKTFPIQRTGKVSICLNAADVSDNYRIHKNRSEMLHSKESNHFNDNLNDDNEKTHFDLPAVSPEETTLISEETINEEQLEDTTLHSQSGLFDSLSSRAWRNRILFESQQQFLDTDNSPRTNAASLAGRMTSSILRDLYRFTTRFRGGGIDVTSNIDIAEEDRYNSEREEVYRLAGFTSRSDRTFSNTEAHASSSVRDDQVRRRDVTQGLFQRYFHNLMYQFYMETFMWMYISVTTNPRYISSVVLIDLIGQGLGQNSEDVLVTLLAGFLEGSLSSMGLHVEMVDILLQQIDIRRQVFPDMIATLRDISVLLYLRLEPSSFLRQFTEIIRQAARNVILQQDQTGTSISNARSTSCQHDELGTRRSMSSQHDLPRFCTPDIIARYFIGESAIVLMQKDDLECY
jgi:hypothetical protein